MPALRRALKRGRNHTVNLHAALRHLKQLRHGTPNLFTPRIVQRNIGSALKPVIYIPVGLPVPKQKNLTGRFSVFMVGLCVSHGLKYGIIRTI